MDEFVFGGASSFLCARLFSGGGHETALVSIMPAVCRVDEHIPWATLAVVSVSGRQGRAGARRPELLALLGYRRFRRWLCGGR